MGFQLPSSQWQQQGKRAKNRAFDMGLQAQELQRNLYNEAMSFQQPYYDYGKRQLGEFEKWGKDPNAITSDPSYQFRRSQAIDDVENSAAARGGALSGNAFRAITDRSSDLASQEYNNEFQRWLQKIGIGQGAANNLSNISSQEAQVRPALWSGIGQNWFNNELAINKQTLENKKFFNNVLSGWFGPGSGG